MMHVCLGNGSAPPEILRVSVQGCMPDAHVGNSTVTKFWLKGMNWIPLLNAHNITGDFVAAEQEEDKLLSVCQAIHALYPDERQVTWW